MNFAIWVVFRKYQYHQYVTQNLVICTSIPCFASWYITCQLCINILTCILSALLNNIINIPIQYSFIHMHARFSFMFYYKTLYNFVTYIWYIHYFITLLNIWLSINTLYAYNCEIALSLKKLITEIWMFHQIDSWTSKVIHHLTYCLPIMLWYSVNSII